MRHPHLTRTAVSLLLALTVVACGRRVELPMFSVRIGHAGNAEHTSFRLHKRQLRKATAPEGFIEGLSRDAFRYFRRLAHPFSARTCRAFSDLRGRLPAAAVHGDAHLEQFVVTEDTFGLEDFDESGFGPAVIDLVRYAASLHVACRQPGGWCNSEEAVDAYFAAYRSSLDHPEERRMPAIVNRLRAATPTDVEAWDAWAEGLMQPLEAEKEALLRAAWDRLVQLMRQTNPDRPEAFYRIERVGRISLGIGSALDDKLLVRIAGPSDGRFDDLFLELRPAERDMMPSCMSRHGEGGAMQVLMITSLLGPRLPEVFGFLPVGDTPDTPELWVQSWDPGYRELSVADVTSQGELNDLAVDAGRQLAGHFWTTFPAPVRGHQRFAQLRAFDETQARARALASTWADEVLREWEAFRVEP